MMLMFSKGVLYTILLNVLIKFNVLGIGTAYYWLFAKFFVLIYL